MMGILFWFLLLVLLLLPPLTEQGEKGHYEKQRGVSGILTPKGNFVVAALNIQKTGSTLFNKAFCDTIKKVETPLKKKHKSLADVGGGSVGLYSWECGPSGGSKKVGRPKCIHHGDITHLSQCLSSRFGTAIFLTVLRDPVQRLVSEFKHLQGDVKYSPSDPSWRNFQPEVCQDGNTTVHVLNERELKDYLDRRNSVLNKTGTMDGLQLEGEHLSLFKEWISLGYGNPANNRMTRHLAGPLTCAESVSKSKIFDHVWMINSAKRNLEDRVIFGLQDDYYASFVLMNSHLLKLFGEDRKHDYLAKNIIINPFLADKKINTKKESTELTYLVDRATIIHIKNYNRMDFALFYIAKRIFLARQQYMGQRKEYREAQKLLSLNVKKIPEDKLDRMKRNRKRVRQGRKYWSNRT